MHPVQLRRRSHRRRLRRSLRPCTSLRRNLAFVAGQSSPVGAAAVLLAGRLAALGVEAGLLRRLRGLRRPAGADRRAARPPAATAVARGRPRGCAPATASRTRCARATGPRRSSSRSRCRGANDVDVAIGNRTSTRVSDVLACWPPGPPEPVVRHSSSSSRITHVDVHAQDATFRDGCTRVARAGVGHGGLGYRPVTFGLGEARGVRTHELGSCLHSSSPDARSGPPPSRWRARPRSSSASAPVGVRSAAAPKPGGSVTYGLEAETGGGWCPSTRPPGHLGHRGGRRHLRHAHGAEHQERDGAVPRQVGRAQRRPSPSGRSRSVTASSSTTARRSTAPTLVRRTSRSTARARSSAPRCKDDQHASPPPARSRSPSPPAARGPSSPGSSTSTAASSSRRPRSSTRPTARAT